LRGNGRRGNAALKRDPDCFRPRKPADDQNAINAATLVGPVFQDRWAIVNEKKKG
jgi:hypothetical protein